MRYPNRNAFAGLVMAACMCVSHAGVAQDEPSVMGLDRWDFVIGEWNVVETRFDFDGKLIETNAGHANFSYAMKDQRIQELISLFHGDEETNALQTFVFDPRSQEIEIARTDSGHYGFWVIVGTMSDDRIDLVEKYPDPDSQVTRRISYRRIDADNFARQLEFSTDGGESWFVRSEWRYTRA